MNWQNDILKSGKYTVKRINLGNQFIISKKGDERQIKVTNNGVYSYNLTKDGELGKLISSAFDDYYWDKAGRPRYSLIIDDRQSINNSAYWLNGKDYKKVIKFIKELGY